MKSCRRTDGRISGARIGHAPPTRHLGARSRPSYRLLLCRNPLDPCNLLAERTVGFFEVVVRLQAKPEALAGVERGGKAYGSVGADATLAQHDFIDATRRHARGAGEGVLADTEWCEKFFKQHFAGVDVGQAFHVVPCIQW